MAMTFNVVPDKASGDVFTEAMWDDSIKTNINNLRVPPSCRAIRNSDYTYTNNTAVQWNNDSTANYAWDTDGMWTSGSNTRVTMSTAGVYIITASFYVVGTTNITVSQSYIRANGTTSIAELDLGQNKLETLGSLSSTFVSDGDDYVELFVNCTGGGTLTFKGSINHLGATWLGQTS